MYFKDKDLRNQKLLLELKLVHWLRNAKHSKFCTGKMWSSIVGDYRFSRLGPGVNEPKQNVEARYELDFFKRKLAMEYF